MDNKNELIQLVEYWIEKEKTGTIEIAFRNGKILPDVNLNESRRFGERKAGTIKTNVR